MPEVVLSQLVIRARLGLNTLKHLNITIMLSERNG
jgi:hypothetical protein